MVRFHCGAFHCYVRAILFLALASLGLLGCSSSTDAPDDPIGLGYAFYLVPTSESGGVGRVQVLLDDQVLEDREFSPATPHEIFLASTGDILIAEGAHTLSLRVLDQLTETATYRVTGWMVVVSVGSNQAHQHEFPDGDFVLREGEAISLEFTASR